MSKPDPLALAREFVLTVERFAAVPGMMASYDLGKLAICRALIEAHEHKENAFKIAAHNIERVRKLDEEAKALHGRLSVALDEVEMLRREARAKLAQQFADEVATWPSDKLRRCLAQPEAVAAAEEREAKAKHRRKPRKPS